MATFAELGLSEPLLEALQHLGYEQPTPIQEQAIPELLNGRDVSDIDRPRMRKRDPVGHFGERQERHAYPLYGHHQGAVLGRF